MTMSDRNALSV